MGQHQKRQVDREAPRSRARVADAAMPLARLERVAAQVGQTEARAMGDGLVRSGAVSASAAARAVGAGAPVLRRAKDSGSVEPTALIAELGAGAALSPAMRAALEARFAETGTAVDFSTVRIHTDGAAHALCERLNAEAFTVGTHIAFRQGAFVPSTREGLELVAHELTHVIQSARGIAAGDVSAGVSRPGDAVEREADHTAEAVVAAEAGAAAEPATSAPAASEGGSVLHIPELTVAPRATALAKKRKHAGAPERPVEIGDVVSGWVIYENEARRGGTLAWRNNNPGNIIAGRFATAHGAYAGKSNARFAIFPTRDIGFLAIQALLRTSNYMDKSIADAISTYAPAADHNDPVAYAASIERSTGLQATKLIRDLTDAELESVANAITRVEGWRVGTSVTRVDERLPERARATGPATPSAQQAGEQTNGVARKALSDAPILRREAGPEAEEPEHEEEELDAPDNIEDATSEAQADRTAAVQMAAAGSGVTGPATNEAGHAATGDSERRAVTPAPPVNATANAAGASATNVQPAQPGDVVGGWVVYEAEARRGGTLAWRNNNPGNIRAGAFATRHGAYAGKRSGGFAVFPTYESGFAAITALLAGNYAGLSIADTIARYAPSADSNDPVAYAAHISRVTGLDSSKKIGDLSPTELESVARAIESMEGWRVGTVRPRTDPSLPATVRVPGGAAATPAAPAQPGARTNNSAAAG